MKIVLNSEQLKEFNGELTKALRVGKSEGGILITAAPTLVSIESFGSNGYVFLPVSAEVKESGSVLLREDFVRLMGAIPSSGSVTITSNGDDAVVKVAKSSYKVRGLPVEEFLRPDFAEDNTAAIVPLKEFLDIEKAANFVGGDGVFSSVSASIAPDRIAFTASDRVMVYRLRSECASSVAPEGISFLVPKAAVSMFSMFKTSHEDRKLRISILANNNVLVQSGEGAKFYFGTIAGTYPDVTKFFDAASSVTYTPVNTRDWAQAMDTISTISENQYIKLEFKTGHPVVIRTIDSELNSAEETLQDPSMADFVSIVAMKPILAFFKAAKSPKVDVGRDRLLYLSSKLGGQTMRLALSEARLEK